MTTKHGFDIPTEGRPTTPTSADALVGIDGNAFSVLGHAKRLMQRAGASPAYCAAYMREAMSGDYDHLLAATIAYLDPEAD